MNTSRIGMTLALAALGADTPPDARASAPQEPRRVELQWKRVEAVPGKATIVQRGLERRGVERLDLPQGAPLIARPTADGGWVIEHAEQASNRPDEEAQR